MKSVFWGGLFVVLLSACMTPSPNLIRSSENGPDLLTEGVVVMKVSGEGPGVLFGIGTAKFGFLMAFREESNPGHFYVFSREKKHVAFHVRAGRYHINHMNSGDIVLVREPLPDLAYNPDFDIPVRPFEIKAGDVLYLGDLLVKGARFEETIVGKAPHITYEISSDPDAARAILQEKYPSIADQMEIHPFVLDQ